jgi:hypothetical protein
MSSALTIALSIHATKANVKSMMNRKKSSTSSDMKTGGVRKISVREIDDSAQFLWERKSHQDIEKMRELARTDEFSDSESDGVASEIDSEPELPVDDINHQELDHDIILVSSQQKEVGTQ